jgi:hypothetical protein
MPHRLHRCVKSGLPFYFKIRILVIVNVARLQLAFVLRKRLTQLTPRIHQLPRPFGGNIGNHQLA